MASHEDHESEPLIIDRAAAAEIPKKAAIDEWAREKRAFISSVMSELSNEREAAAAALREVGVRPVMFEKFGGRDADPENAYLSEVETSDIYIGILGRRYGKPLSSRFSATHAEYRHAETFGLRIAAWTFRTDREGPQQSFLDEIRTFHVVPEFTSSEDLQAQITERLKEIAAEDLAPWCKFGNLVFRATEVTDRGETLSVIAQIRSQDVAHALEELRGDKFQRGYGAQFSWGGRSKFVRLTGMETTTTAARSRTVRLQFEEVEKGKDSMLEMSFNGYSSDDLTEIALRATLFGEPNPLKKQMLGFVAELPDPLLLLRDQRISEEIVRPLVELLLVDSLVGSGRAARVPAFKLGVSISGTRKVRLSWQPPRRYSNEPAPSPRTIEGHIRL